VGGAQKPASNSAFTMGLVIAPVLPPLSVLDVHPDNPEDSGSILASSRIGAGRGCPGASAGFS